MENEIKNLIQAKIKSAFVPEYQSKATEAEGMGLILASYFKWDGLEILKAASAALEDANFHAENRVLAEMIQKLEAEVA